MADDRHFPSPKHAGTGVEGLDNILHGGLPRNRLYLIQGSPGVGKTTLALQFLLEGARLGESGLYITLSETKEELDLVAQSHGWDLGALHLFELAAVEESLRGETESTFFHPSEVELNHTTRTILAEIERVNPARVVFDSLSEMRLLAGTPLRYRRQVLQLKHFFGSRDSTVLLLDDGTDRLDGNPVESLAHGVIGLSMQSPDYGVSRRLLNVMKLRGSRFREGNHDLVLRRGGMVVFPRLVAAEHHREFKRETASSGVPTLDTLLGGGLDRGTSSVFMGPAGAGKSTLAVRFALAAAERGEQVMVYIFDETEGIYVHRALQLGIDITPHLASGLFVLQQVDPAELSPGELAHRIVRDVSERTLRMVVIDSMNGYLHSMPADRYLTLQLHELLTFLNQQGVITVMTLTQQGLLGNMQSVIDLTYLADTVLLLRFFEARGAVRQAVSVIKKRSGDHERTIRELRMGGPHGIELGPPLVDMQGVLTGVPSFVEGHDRVRPSAS